MQLNKYEKCYECGSNDLTYGEIELTSKVGNHVVAQKALGYTCKNCGEQWFWIHELSVAECRAAHQVFSTGENISQGEIKFARKALGLKVIDFARKICAPDDVVWDNDMTMLKVTPEIISKTTLLLDDQLKKLTVHDDKQEVVGV
jgi:predicted nucleic-acid-binding Zn-ribbon protein